MKSIAIFNRQFCYYLILHDSTGGICYREFFQSDWVVTIETSMTGMDEAVVVDATDVKVLNAATNLLGTFAGIEAGYNLI